jgi:hypothetical protein
MYLHGCALSQDGKVFVLNLECTIARWVSKDLFSKSGKKGKS